MDKPKSTIAFSELQKALNLKIRKLERKRMRELVFEYSHIRDKLMTSLGAGHLDLKWINKLPIDERLAARDWRLVLGGKSPQSGHLWKSLETAIGPINSFKELSEEIMSKQTYQFYG